MFSLNVLAMHPITTLKAEKKQKNRQRDREEAEKKLFAKQGKFNKFTSFLKTELNHLKEGMEDHIEALTPPPIKLGYTASKLRKAIASRARFSFWDRMLCDVISSVAEFMVRVIRFGTGCSAKKCDSWYSSVVEVVCCLPPPPLTRLSLVFQLGGGLDLEGSHAVIQLRASRVSTF
jgi:hypothetical protein